MIAAAALAGTTAVMVTTSELLNHQFVLIKTKKWLYVVAKDCTGFQFFQVNHDLKNKVLDTQKQYEKATRPLQADPTPMVWQEDKGKH